MVRALVKIKFITYPPLIKFEFIVLIVFNVIKLFEARILFLLLYGFIITQRPCD